jgi:NADPH:quinone reductase-like Zn-dependent oxidoreductase
LKKIVIHKPGSYERLLIEDHPDPLPGPGEVLIDVAACGVNYADCVTRMGLYASARHYVGYPITPGFEVAGRVAATGSAVTDLPPGTPVMAVTRFNGYATRLATKRSQIVPLPASLSAEQAAGFPAVALTAWYALFEQAHPRDNETVLVHSAAGGVGGMLVQLGKLAGCRVIGVVGAGHKIGTVRELGADAVIDKSAQNLWREAERLAPGGYDIILDANGVSTLRESYRHLAPAGRLVVYGFHSMLPRRGGIPHRLQLAWHYWRTPRFSPFSLTTRNRSVIGFNLSFLFERSGQLSAGLRQLLHWLEAGKLAAPGITAYPFDRVADAHRDLESGQTTGKLVLLVTNSA